MEPNWSRIWKLPMHFKWKNPCQIQHRIENIQSVDEEQIFDDPKWNQIQAEFENSPRILNGKNLTEFGTELKK